jgi:hypothetical protein
VPAETQSRVQALFQADPHAPWRSLVEMRKHLTMDQFQFGLGLLLLALSLGGLLLILLLAVLI